MKTYPLLFYERSGNKRLARSDSVYIISTGADRVTGTAVLLSGATMSNRRTPLYQWHVDHNARMVPFGGWDMPVQYSGIMEEHKAVRSVAGLFDISHMARLSFAGKDVLALLEMVITNSVASMKDGQVKYGLICKPDGGILDDVLVYRYPGSYAMVVNAGNREKIVSWLLHHAHGTDVKIEDQTETTAMIAIQGPKAVAMVAGKFAADVSTLKYYYVMPTQFKNVNCIVSRTGYTGEDGFEIIIANDHAHDMWDELICAGALPCGLGARDTLRLEAAMPLYGHELNEEIDPIQAGLGWAVKLDKGDFIGRDALRASKPTSTRVGLELEGKRAAREGSPILAGNTPIGTVTSGSFVPWLEKSIAMGYIRGTHTTVDVDIRGSRIPAKVVPLPFYKRAKS
ncbi:glycine cleavage system aminomethyltransferase GcvT [soil metagenome]